MCFCHTFSEHLLNNLCVCHDDWYLYPFLGPKFFHPKVLGVFHDDDSMDLLKVCICMHPLWQFNQRPFFASNCDDDKDHCDDYRHNYDDHNDDDVVKVPAPPLYAMGE